MNKEEMAKAIADLIAGDKDPNRVMKAAELQKGVDETYAELEKTTKRADETLALLTKATLNGSAPATRQDKGPVIAKEPTIDESMEEFHNNWLEANKKGK